MAIGDYNSPYTGQQLDDTIRKISSNNIHTYVKVFDNANGIEVVGINSLPAGPDGLRTGIYDVIYSETAAARNTSRIRVDELSLGATGSGRSNIFGDGTPGNDLKLYLSQVAFKVSDQSFHAYKDHVNITDPSDLLLLNQPMKIYEIWRQDTIA